MDDIIYLTPRQLAKRWDMHVMSLANLRSKGRGPVFVKVGPEKHSLVRYRLADIQAYERQINAEVKTIIEDGETLKSVQRGSVQ